MNAPFELVKFFPNPFSIKATERVKNNKSPNINVKNAFDEGKVVQGTLTLVFTTISNYATVFALLKRFVKC